LEVFIERLRSAPLASDGLEAKQLIDETLNTVEDELTDIPFDPDHWRTDGRMYPVQDDNAGDVDGHPEVTSYRSKKHETLIRTNGAFEIRDARTLDVLIAKAGSDGRGVWS
jgi:hypothetical protein